MTRQMWVELIQRFLASEMTQEQRRRYHDLEIEKLIDNVYSDIIYDICLNAMAYRDDSQLDSFVKPYIVKVKFDEARKEHYIDLPAPVLSLPKNRGIRLVCPVDDQSAYYRQTDNNSFKTLKKLDIWWVTNVGRFYREGDKLFLMNDKNVEFDKVLLTKLIVPFSSFDDDEEISIAGGKSSLLYQNIIKVLVGKPADDKINDNN